MLPTPTPSAARLANRYHRASIPDGMGSGGGPAARVSPCRDRRGAPPGRGIPGRMRWAGAHAWPRRDRAPPPRRGIVLHLLEGDALAVVRADLSPVGGDVDLPIQHRAVEPRESARIGTVDDEAWEACDSHASHGMRRY